MAALLVIIIIGAIVWYTKVYNSPNAKAVRALTIG
jgi:hypothetical protein